MMRPKWMMLCAAALAGGLCGCGSSGPKYVPVSGTVALDGKPYGDAVVVFLPKATPGNPNPGRSSAGETDPKGHFVLKTDEMKNGAVPGKHLVKISTRGLVMPFDPATGSPDSAPPTVKRDLIPAEWNTMSDKEFDVPPGGTDKANFEIVRKKN
jgi:predicted small lipoprotein YifL